ncbi:twin-arginine translocase TatA/TatE family subunit [bacterium]|nr:twin-arginine translocase TatA/TatE family subunit [bacterium]MBU1599239.1 twin-arginine translocase TatA/TatE family subunit [bacterium]
MIAGLGPTELGFILLIALVIFGAERLTGIGGALGKGIRDFKKGLSGADEGIKKVDEEVKKVSSDKEKSG